jgi:MFS family permease
MYRWVVGLALLADTVPQERLATATGWLSLGMSLGLLVAPLLGGVVYDRAGYNAVFGMAYGLIGLDIVLRLLLVEKKVAARWDPDAVGRPAATNPPITTNTDEEKDIAASVPEQTVSTTPPPQRLRDRLPPVLSLLYSRRLIAALFCSLVQAALLTSFDSVLTLHAATIFHWTSTGASLLFLPLVIPSFLAPLFGYLSDKFGARYFVVVAFLCACPPLVCLRFIDENTLHDKILLCALLAVTGFFLAITFPPIMAEISGVVEAKEKSMLAAGRQGFGQAGAFGQAYALFNVAFAGGCMVGPLVAGFVVQEKGWAAMACVLGVLSAVTSLPAALWLGGWVFVKK